RGNIAGDCGVEILAACCRKGNHNLVSHMPYCEASITVAILQRGVEGQRRGADCHMAAKGRSESITKCSVRLGIDPSGSAYGAALCKGSRVVDGGLRRGSHHTDVYR